MKLSRWDGAAWGIIGLHVLFLFPWWPVLPFFVDAYYHLNVVQGFRDSAGIALHAFWEWAPAGRPHLYPPALHVGLLLLDGLHLHPIALARLASILSYASLLIATWWCSRVWLDSRKAYWVTLCSVLPFSYLLVACNTLAASWATIWWLTGLIAVRRKAFMASALCVGLVFFTHLGTPWLLVGSWLLLALLEKPLRKFILSSLLAGMGMGSLWVWYLWNHRAQWHAVSTHENRLIEISVVVYLLAALGGAVAVRKETPLRRHWLFSLFVGFLPLGLNYRFRLFSGQGLLPVFLLAGIGAAEIEAWSQVKLCNRQAHLTGLAPVLLTLSLLMGNLTWFMGEKSSWIIGDTSISHLAFQDERQPRSNAVSFYYPRLVDPLVEIIRRQSRPDDLIGCNDPYLCAMVSAISHRATTAGMLAEAQPQGAALSDELANARIVLWFKDDEGAGAAALKDYQANHALRVLAETEMATVFLNPQANATRKTAPAVLPLGWAKSLLMAALIAISVDLWRNRNRRWESA